MPSQSIMFNRVSARSTLTMALACALALGLSVQASAQSAPSPFGAPVIRTRTVRHHEVIDNSANTMPSIVDTPPAVIDVQRKLEDLTAAQSSGAEVVTLSWDKHSTYRIPIRVGNFTTLTMPAGSSIVQAAFTDPKALQVSIIPATNSIMVRLMQPISVPGTIVTSTRNYFVTLVPSNSLWYQGVYWRSESDGTTDGIPSMPGVYAGAAASVAPPARKTSLEASLGGQPNFNYRISGNADFRPLAVWDNGRFTWIQFKRNVEELPAVFVEGRNGLGIVNYTVHDDGTQIMVNRLMPSFVLRVGREDIKVTARGAN